MKQNFIIKLIFKFSSKILYIWSFILEGKQRKIEFWDSKISGKKRLTADSKELLNDKIKSDNFSYSFKIERHFFTILKSKDDFELKVDNLFFIDIMNDERCGKLEKMRNMLKNKEKMEEIQNNKKQKRNIEKEDDYDYGNEDFYKGSDLNFENEGKYNINFRENNNEDNDNDIIDDIDVAAIKNNLEQSHKKKQSI